MTQRDEWKAEFMSALMNYIDERVDGKDGDWLGATPWEKLYRLIDQVVLKDEIRPHIGPGTILFGFCGGVFGSGSDHDKVIEAMGSDWVIARALNSAESVGPEMAVFNRDNMFDQLAKWAERPEERNYEWKYTSSTPPSTPVSTEASSGDRSSTTGSGSATASATGAPSSTSTGLNRSRVRPDG